jgi:hypothetical protein
VTTLRANALRGLAALAVGALAATACGPRPGGGPASAGTIGIMGAARVNAAQMAAWFNGRTPHPSGTYNATVPVQTLAQIFLEEGAAEGVRGDAAFVQSVLETGWFRFGGSVPGSYNNFAGLGATDSGGTPASFPDARTGVRAQIQHLRAYADAGAVSCTVPPLHNPCVDPRFNLVSPTGKATTWNMMGNGNWATSTTYAQRILQLYSEMLAYNGVPVS